MNLSADKVHETFIKCLFKEEEPKDNPVIVEGVMMKIGFNPDRIKEKLPDIDLMLSDLPDSFKKSGGGGMSFLNMCNDKEGNQWADMHQTMDELITLGLATGKLSFLMPRELWQALPGGMPYVQIDY